MPVFLLVGLAGALGAVLRYSVSLLLPFSGSVFPFATLFTNLLGSFVLAWLIAYFSGKRQLSERVEAIIYTGLIGSFTTFSTFSVEMITLFQQSAYFSALMYGIISAVGGFMLALYGFSLGKRSQGEGGTAS